MRFWWVNQNQTFEQERYGGYLWSPKRKADNGINHFYETMREVAPGDIIFSFCKQRIPAISIAQSYAIDSPKPEEFGKAGGNWATFGWRIDVQYHDLHHVVVPRAHMDLLAPVLPSKYSPLRLNGDGLQGVYLTEVPAPMAEVLVLIIGIEAQSLVEGARSLVRFDDALAREEDTQYQVEERIEDSLVAVPSTERRELVNSRRGQGIFRSNVVASERGCRVTGVTNPEHLIASHITPWRHASNRERLDGNNGLLLTPNVDAVFDKGFITFAGSGELLVSPVADRDSLQRMGIPVNPGFNVGTFNRKQSENLEYHLHSVFKRAER